MFGYESVGDGISQRTAYARYFQTVSQSVVYEDASWKWKYLGLVLQATEGSREDEPVEIALEF